MEEVQSCVYNEIMKKRQFLLTSSVLSLCGVLFAGYISFSKLFTGQCPLNESCPYFLGYPACWFGLGLFSILLAGSLSGYFNLIDLRTSKWWVGVVSFLGILFAGQFVIEEATLYFSGSVFNYALGLPSCVYGLIFYIALFIISLLKIKMPVENSFIENSSTQN